jgi:acetyl-CoA/propionyl-CoA carboxylase biotin carboxyl carrier protein
VEEAPAPFLTQEQNAILYESSKAILKEAGYLGAGTCEFLIGQDGTISFLEVNTRLQVEHPVSEEITGIDLVREQFRIAEGGALDYDDPPHYGHSIEFRINGEDPGKGFLPTPGPVHSVRFPGGPGVRVDSGITTGDIVTGTFDSLLAKLIVTGATRTDAIEKARRALKEFEITGLPTVIPFHRAILEDSSFIAESGADFAVHTSWIETEFDADIEPWDGSIQGDFGEAELFRTVVVEVEGRRLKVGVPAGIFVAGERAALARAPQRAVRDVPASGAREGIVKALMQATVTQIWVESGDTVVEGDRICVLEAMKMEQIIYAPIDGRVVQVGITIGDSVSAGEMLVEIV